MLTGAGGIVGAADVLRGEMDVGRGGVDVIVAHQRLPEWGSPKPPMTLEALIVHYADDLDAKLQMVVCVMQEEPTDTMMTSKRNALNQQFYRGTQT